MVRAGGNVRFSGESGRWGGRRMMEAAVDISSSRGTVMEQNENMMSWERDR